MPIAKVVLSTAILRRSNVDLESEVRILAQQGSTVTPLFTGLVDTVTPGPNEITVDLVSVGQSLRETRLGGFAGIRVSGREVMWSILRSQGFPEDRIDIQGFRRGPVEEFQVVVPLDGIDVTNPNLLGDVQLLPAAPLLSVVEESKLDVLVERYKTAGAWAHCRHVAATLLEAETAGLAAIDLALAWLTVASRFSSVGLPGSTDVRRYRRDWGRARISRMNVVVVRGNVSGRAWLRAPGDSIQRPKLRLDEVDDLPLLSLPTSLPPQTKEAVKAWRRAVEAADGLATVMALWQAIEFYAAEASAPQLFSPDDKAKLKAQFDDLLQGFEEKQRKRVMDILAWVNDAPLLARLKIALADDSVPYTDAEFDLLQPRVSRFWLRKRIGRPVISLVGCCRLPRAAGAWL